MFEAVTRYGQDLRNEQVVEATDTYVDLNVAAQLPEGYAGEDALRLGLYRRLSGVESPADVDAFAAEIADRFVRESEAALREDRLLPDYLELETAPELDNTWGDTAKAIINNWLGLVYGLTNLDRKLQYMDGVDPDDPLRMKNTL